MLDSMGKPWTSGLLLRNYNWDGNPEECQKAKLSYEGFQTHYCSVFWHFKKNSSEDEVLRGRLGLCLPSSCHGDLISDLFQEGQKAVGLISLLQPDYIPEEPVSFLQKLGISRVQCANENQNFGPEGKLILCLLVFYLFLVAVVSIVDYINTTYAAKKKGILIKEAKQAGNLPCIVKCFSIQRNYSEIMDTKKNGGEAEHFFNVLRVISFLQVLLFFAYFKFIVDGTSKYTDQVVNVYNGGNHNFVMYSSPLDTFLFIGGFLFARSYTKVFQRRLRGGFSFLTLTASRYLRLAPAFMCIVYLRWVFWRFLSASSYWQKDLCQNSSLWRLWSLFFDSKEAEHCLFVGWYISCDFKFFMLALVIMFCCRRSKLTGKLAIATFWIVPLVMAVVTDSQYFNSNSFDVKYLHYWLSFFFDWKLRFGSYLIGLLLGMVWVTSDHFDRHRIGLMPGLSWTLWGIACMLLSTYRSHLIGNTLLFSGFGYVLAWNLWALGLASLVYGVQVTEFPEWIARLGSKKYLILVCRLSYSASLLLEPVLDYVMHSTYHTGDYTTVGTKVLVVGAAVVTFLVAFPFCLVFELPFVQLGRLLRKSK